MNNENKKGVENNFRNCIPFSVFLNELQNVVIILSAESGKENMVARTESNDVDIAVNPKGMKEQLIKEWISNDYS